MARGTRPRSRNQQLRHCTTFYYRTEFSSLVLEDFEMQAACYSNGG